MLRAAVALASEGIVRPILVGDPGSVSKALAAERLDATGVEVRAPQEWGQAVEEDIRSAALQACAVALAAGRVDGVVAGAVLSTAQVLRAGLKGIGLREGLSTLSSAFYMEVGDFRDLGPEVLTFTDAGVVPDPDAEQLAEIALEAARARPHIVGDDPRVAFLSFSTAGSADSPSVRKMVEALERFRALAPDVPADGELQVDAALIPEVAARKASRSQVAGTANVPGLPRPGRRKHRVQARGAVGRGYGPRAHPSKD